MLQNNPTRPSVMTHDFSRVPNVEIPRSSFDRSHGVKTAFDAGLLIPILCDEALPGDTFSVNLTGFARLATPLRPVMDNMYMETFFFAVPYRLVWDNWQKFHGEQDNPGDSIDFTVPTFVNSSGVTQNELHDYMGVPPDVTNLQFNSLFARAYYKIYNDWFRDQNLQDSLVIQTDDGAGEAQSDYVLQRRGKRHDYFTSGLPFPQKGDSVDLPLGTTAPVISEGTGIPLFDVGSLTNEPITKRTTLDEAYWSTTSGGSGDATWADTALEVDLSSATAATINQLRQAFQVQRLLERDARGGTRYTEIIRSHFQVESADQRLQRPEYLGGGSSPVNITTVPATNDNTFTETYVGDLGGYGTSMLSGHGFSKSFTEHCLIIGLVNVRADLTYQQGLPRMFSRQTRYDYYYPVLSQIGEQAILNKEIYAQGTAVPDDDVFAYQERFAEYRYKPSLITGRMRSTATTPLDVWHLSQEFGSLPVLDSAFIEDNPPIDRVIAVPSEPHFLFDGYFSMRCARPMPMYGVPGMIDHF